MQREFPNIGKNNNDDINTISKDQLNFKQRLVYDLVEDWVNEKVKGRTVVPLYLNLSGRAGCHMWLMGCPNPCEMQESCE